MNDTEQTERIARLQADVKNLCRSMDELKSSVAKIADALSEHRVLSAERAAIIAASQSRIEEHEGRIKNLEAATEKAKGAIYRLVIYVALGAGGAAFGVDKIMGIFK